MTRNNYELVLIDMTSEKCPKRASAGSKCFTDVNEDWVFQTSLKDALGYIRKVFTNIWMALISFRLNQMTLGPGNLDIMVAPKRISRHLDRPYDPH